MNKAIEVVITQEGQISIDAVGFQGSDCEAATRFLEQALGELQTKEHKPEYQRKASVQKQQRLGT